VTNRFRVSSTLARRLEELGVPPVAVLRQAGLPAGLFDQSRILVTTEEMFGVYRAIHEISGDPAIGLNSGARNESNAIVQPPSPRSTAARFAMPWSESRVTSA
jgi:hypothetical protein